MKLLLLLCNGRLTRTVGGKEKVFCEFANEFVRRSWEVGAAYDAFGAAPPVFRLDSRVRLFNLNGLKRPPLTRQSFTGSDASVSSLSLLFFLPEPLRNRSTSPRSSETRRVIKRVSSRRRRSVFGRGRRNALLSPP